MQPAQAVFACSCGQLTGWIPEKWHYAEKLEFFAVSSALYIPEGWMDVKRKHNREWVEKLCGTICGGAKNFIRNRGDRVGTPIEFYRI